MERSDRIVVNNGLNMNEIDKNGKRFEELINKPITDLLALFRSTYTYPNVNKLSDEELIKHAVSKVILEIDMPATAETEESIIMNYSQMYDESSFKVLSDAINSFPRSLLGFSDNWADQLDSTISPWVEYHREMTLISQSEEDNDMLKVLQKKIHICIKDLNNKQTFAKKYPVVVWSMAASGQQHATAVLVSTFDTEDMNLIQELLDPLIGGFSQYSVAYAKRLCIAKYMYDNIMELLPGKRHILFDKSFLSLYNYYYSDCKDIGEGVILPIVRAKEAGLLVVIDYSHPRKYSRSNITIKIETETAKYTFSVNILKSAQIYISFMPYIIEQYGIERVILDLELGLVPIMAMRYIRENLIPTLHWDEVKWENVAKRVLTRCRNVTFYDGLPGRVLEYAQWNPDTGWVDDMFCQLCVHGECHDEVLHMLEMGIGLGKIDQAFANYLPPLVYYVKNLDTLPEIGNTENKNRKINIQRIFHLFIERGINTTFSDPKIIEDAVVVLSLDKIRFLLMKTNIKDIFTYENALAFINKVFPDGNINRSHIVRRIREFKSLWSS